MREEDTDGIGLKMQKGRRMMSAEYVPKGSRDTGKLHGR